MVLPVVVYVRLPRRVPRGPGSPPVALRPVPVLLRPRPSHGSRSGRLHVPRPPRKERRRTKIHINRRESERTGPRWSEDFGLTWVSCASPVRNNKEFKIVAAAPTPRRARTGRRGVVGGPASASPFARDRVGDGQEGAGSRRGAATAGRAGRLSGTVGSSRVPPG